MKSRIIASLIFFIFTVMKLYAQPLPPSTPDGNAVPVGGLSLIVLLIGGIAFFLNQKKK